VLFLHIIVILANIIVHFILNKSQAISKERKWVPDSSGFVEEQSASFPGRDDDLRTLFCLTSSLARLAARAA